MTRQETLTQQLMRYAEAYYDADTPVISDAEYDALYDELVQLEEESGFSLPGSPTKRVGATAGSFLPHTHIRRLYSLDKVRTEEALADWANRAMKAAEGVTEELKARNQLEWVRRMNNIRNRAEEIINSELIYI